MWHRIGVRVALSVGLLATAIGCGGDDGRKQVIPVSGVVMIDGEPAAGVSIKAHNVAGFDTENTTVTSGITDTKGKFSLSTYEQGDGAPEGKYQLTFTWKPMNVLSMRYDGPDRLRGRYEDPAASQVVVETSAAEGPVDLGTIELSTK